MKTITTEGKKSLSLLLIFAIIIGLLPPMTMPVWAKEGTPLDNTTVTMSVYGASITADTYTPIAGVDNEITLTVKDSDGNADTTFSGTTDLTITGAEAAPKGSYGRLNGTDLTADAEADPGQTISVTFNEGQATANLSLHKAGNQTITFRIAGVTEPATRSFDIQPAALDTMTLTPDILAPTEYGGEFARQPVITLQDAYGNRCTNDNTTQVTASVKDTGDWTLTGTTTITAVNGQANFTNLGAANIVEIEKAQIAFNLTNSASRTMESNMALLNTSALPQVVTSAVTLQPWESTLGDGVYIEQIAAGSNHSLALTSTGVVYAWGYGVYGQLGDGVFHSPTSHTSGMVLRPVKVLDGAMGNTGVTAISASDSYSVALKDGVVYAWGWGVYGRLGNGSTNSQNTPVKVSDGLGEGQDFVNEDVTAIAAGEYHALAIKNHQVYAWGYNNSGVLGIGEYTNPPVTKDTPVKVLAGAMGSDEKVIAIAASQVNSLALTETGVVYAWGSGEYGRLGNGSDVYTIADKPVAVQIGEMDNTGVTAIAVGIVHSLALKGGVVYAWGWGANGELGNGKDYRDKGTKNVYFESTPVKVSDGGDGQEFINADVTAIAVGGQYSLAIKGGVVYAWGMGSLNQMGNNSTLSQTTPVKVWVGEMETNENVTAIAAGYGHSLAIKEGQAYAWGPGGLIGDGTFNNARTPVRVAQHADWGSTITISNIPGVTPPVTGGVPVTTITETTQYTGTVTWSPAHNPFQAGTIYTATITLTPKNGYTLNGVTANFFKVAGATATHAANTGVVTAIFPATSSPSTPGTTNTYTVGYNGNGATSGSVPSQATNVGTATTLAANTFTRTGYTFTGWNTAANGTGTAYAPGASVPSQTAVTTITLYAQWQLNTPVPTTYTLAYNANGGTGTVAPQTTNVGTATTVAANSFTRAGYTFTGWNTAANGTGTSYAAAASVPSQTTGTTITLYAQWQSNTTVPTTYTLEYNANGGTGTVAPQTTNVGTATTLAANTFTRTGYTFTGWNTAANGTGTSYAAAASVPSQTTGTTITLYAQWQSNTPVPTTYTLEYNANGGTGTVAPQTTNVGTATTAAANTFTRTGYTFTGWNTAANGTGTSYAAGASVPSQTVGTTVTLYAQWQLTTYIITYNANGGTGSVPTDSVNYASRAYARVMSKGSLARAGYTFLRWNTEADGSGTSYKTNDTFAVSANTTLYARWEKIISAQIPQIKVSNVRGTETVVQSVYATPVSVTAAVYDGGTLTYQWYENTSNNMTGGTPLSGQTGTSYTPPTDAPGTNYYYVMVTNTLTVDGQVTQAVNTSGCREQIVLAEAPMVYFVSNTTGSSLVNLTLSNPYATQYQNYTVTMSVYSGYTLPANIIVKEGGITLTPGTDYIYNKTTGELADFRVTDQVVIFAAAVAIPVQTYTLSFVSNTDVSAPAFTGAYGTTITYPSLVKAGYTMMGWYRDSAFATSYTATTMSAENITLYAKWVQSTYSITGEVKDEDNLVVSGATIKLMAGNRQIAQTTTDAGGEFSVSGVSRGTYNLVISKGSQTITLIITVTDDNIATGTITLPKGNKNSILEVKPNTPDIIVDKLNDFFSSSQFTQDDRNIVDAGGTIEIKLVIEKKDESGDNAAANAENIKAVAGSGKEIGLFLDLTVSKNITPSSGIAEKPILIRELYDVLIIDIPLPVELQGKSDYVIYRYHGTEVQTITQTANTDGEYLVVSADGKSIRLYTKKFSTYAIAYAAATGNNNGGSDSDVPKGKPTVENTDGGKVIINTDNNTATIIPDEGYVIADVIVNGHSVGAMTTYTYTEGETPKIKAVFVKKTALPYYMQDGKKVFIGFTAVMDKILKYTAPVGVTVQFMENPKNFEDIDGHRAKANIDFVTEREILEGTALNIYAPQVSMTRAMFVTVIGRMYERSYQSIKSKTIFADVNNGEYYAPYVGWTHENGIIEGIGENKFAPDAAVTREQMAAIMFRFATFLKKVPMGNWMINVTYPDKADISDWAMNSAAYCQLTGIIIGRDEGQFVPKGTATRAEVAAVIERFVKEILKF